MEATNVIDIQGARVHNLANIDVQLPRERLIVVTGVSGSGKSSLVFDTLYAEGHRRYVESLSSYARQFLSRMQKPDVDQIQGLSPAIAIQQRSISANPRSTVGSITEIFDYLRLLFARIGRTTSPVTGAEVRHDAVEDVAETVLQKPAGTRVYVYAPVPLERPLKEELALSLQKGFSRALLAGEVQEIEDLLQDDALPGESAEALWLLVDRFRLREETDEELRFRVTDSIQTAYNEGQGEALVQFDQEVPQRFSERFEADGIQFEEPSVALFNSNNPYGACPECEGFGKVMGIDEQLVIPDPYKSIADGAVRPWQTSNMSWYQDQFEAGAKRLGVRLDVPYAELTEEERQRLWDGSPDVIGIRGFFADLESQTYKVQYRVMLARYRGYARCPACGGKRLRPEALYVKVHDHDFGDLQDLAVADLADLIEGMPFTGYELTLADRLLTEIRSRLHYLRQVGLGYLQLSRRANTLSGGETQRINLATSLGSTLTGSLYILDEPSIGLHPRDNDRLIAILESLRDLGNTVIVVEHDEAIMLRADHVLDLGPHAGEHGGCVVYNGPGTRLCEESGDSLTGQYLRNERDVPLPAERRTPTQFLEVEGAAQHNLKSIDVRIPLGALSVVTGVSGSGKTTLIRQIVYPALAQALDISADPPGRYRRLRLPPETLRNVEMVDQKAVGRSVFSNPATYVGVFTAIRELFAAQPAARAQQLRAAHFSFNVDGGRCETCEGKGVTTIEMQFLPDIELTCETCGGKRFKPMVLEVTYEERNIYEVLQMTVTEAMDFFAAELKITQRLQQLVDVGLGYLRLGQSVSTLSGGEAQRLKLAAFLHRKEHQPTLYFFDEPTTGLHFEDIRILMAALQQLVNQGHTVVIVEHNLEVIKCADWLVDLGPEGGDVGGHLVYQGPPEGLPEVAESITGTYLAPKLARS